MTCRFVDGSLWLSQAAMGELYQTSKPNLSMHLKHLFEEGEMEENSVVQFYLTTAADGKSYRVKHYKLEVVIAVGCRVLSQRGTQFRQWATARLEEYLSPSSAVPSPRPKAKRNSTNFSPKPRSRELDLI